LLAESIGGFLTGELMKSFFKSFYPTLVYPIILVLTLTGCLSSSGNQEAQALEQTRVAIGQLLTQQANEAQLTQPAQEATQKAQLTNLAEQATLLANQATQETSLTETALALSKSQTPEVVGTPTADLSLKIKAAKILLYENMSGQKIYGVYHPRYVQSALNLAGYAFTDVGSALGWFKDNLLTTTDWDLIIASSEAHSKLSGEYFTYLLNHLDQGSAVILEVWDLDEMGGGTIRPILEKCGVALYSDWSPTSTFTLWPLVPDHPIFHYPNGGISMRNTSPFWIGDHGDLLKVTGSGDAQLLLGTMESNKTDHGTLVSCMNGRLLIQTFRDHDFGRLDIEALWQNYVYYVLKSKFASETK
jgi:hypothetical protein